MHIMHGDCLAVMPTLPAESFDACVCDPPYHLTSIVTPPGGSILDPFGGSGATGMAALAEGFRATLIEMEAESVADINRRLAHVSGADTPLFSGAMS